MKPARIIAFMLLATFAGAGISEAAVLRRQSEEDPMALLKTDPRPTLAGFDDSNASDIGQTEVMKKKKKKAKKKKSKAS